MSDKEPGVMTHGDYLRVSFVSPLGAQWLSDIKAQDANDLLEWLEGRGYKIQTKVKHGRQRHGSSSPDLSQTPKIQKEEGK